jgi:hypothetical protein
VKNCGLIKPISNTEGTQDKYEVVVDRYLQLQQAEAKAKVVGSSYKPHIEASGCHGKPESEDVMYQPMKPLTFPQKTGFSATAGSVTIMYGPPRDCKD